MTRRPKRERGADNEKAPNRRPGLSRIPDRPSTGEMGGRLLAQRGRRQLVPIVEGVRSGARHGCGYALANAGHDTRALQAWLGHKNIQHTVRYTELAPDRFQELLAIGVTSAAGAAAPRTRPFRTIQV